MAPTAVDLLLTKIPNASEIKEFISNNGADEKMLDEWLFERIYKGVDYKEMEEQQREKLAFEYFKAGQESMEEGGKSFDQYYNETYK